MTQDGDDQADTQADRDSRGWFAPGNSVGLSSRFQPGHCPNPGGKPHGPVAALEGYLSGKSKLPASFAERLPEEVWDVLAEHGVGAAVCVGVIALALDPQVDPAIRLKASEWVTNRYDGPVVKQVHKTGDSGAGPTQILIVQRGDGSREEEDVPFPAEVLEIERLEEQAREEAERRRADALGMGGPATNEGEA